jgi:flagellar motor switch protein FliN
MEQVAEATSTMRLLVLDNQRVRSENLAGMLRVRGFASEVAADRRTMLSSLDNGKFDALVCHESIDACVDVLKQVKLTAPGLSLLVLVENPMSPLAEQAVAAGATVVAATGEDYQALLGKLAALQTKVKIKGSPPARMTVHPVQLPPLQPGNVQGENSRVDMLLDVPVSVHAMLGQTSMQISELLELGAGSVVELNKRAGAPVELYVNEKLVAMGEVVVVKDSYGVLITEVIEPTQRVRALG